MKNILGLTLITGVILAGGGALGQSAPQIDRHVEQMKRYLHLSGRQAGVIRADYFSASDEKRLIEHNPSLNTFAKQRRIREINRATNDSVSQILNPRQLAAWQEYRATHSWF